jgi:uncharacterized membrane protein
MQERSAGDAARPPGRGARVAAVLLLCALTLLAGWWLRARCVPDGWGTEAIYAGWCYTDIYPLWFAERLDAGARPYLDHPVEYPVLTGAQMEAAARIARALPADDAEAFFHVTVLGGALVLLGMVGLLAAAGLPPRRLVWVAAAPTLITTSAINWDAVPTALLVAGLLLHLRGRDGWAGVAAGLGAAAKLFPGLLVPVVVLARLAQGRRRDAAVHAAAAAAAWLVVNVPIALAAPEGWRRFLELNRERPADWDSLWFVAQQATGWALDTTVLNLASAVAFVLVAAVVVVVGTRERLAGAPDRWWILVAPLLAAFLLTNKVYSPQFSLWLLPLLPLVLPRVWPFLAFAVADLAVFAFRFPFLNGQAGFEEVLGYGWFGAAVVLRAAALAWIIVACVTPATDDAAPSWRARTHHDRRRVA